jgi:predicted phosphodiesterase
MGYKDLTKKDKKFIKQTYKKYPNQEAEVIIAEKFNAGIRSVQRWKNNLSLNMNILVIGDLHEPFALDGYLEFCKEQYKKFNCKRVIFIGDIIDNHYSSYYETDADGMGGLDELNLAIQKISKWYEAFPEATVIIGNHDRMIMRKAQTSSIPSVWIKEYKDVLNTPNWEFVDRKVIGDVQYIHGEGGTARVKARADMMSTVQGHLHTQCYTEWFVGSNFRIFGSQVGCGIDHDSYAMAYAKRGKKPAIGCMVVLKGELPINLLMEL